MARNKIYVIFTGYYECSPINGRERASYLGIVLVRRVSISDCFLFVNFMEHLCLIARTSPLLATLAAVGAAFLGYKALGFFKTLLDVYVLGGISVRNRVVSHGTSLLIVALLSCMGDIAQKVWSRPRSLGRYGGII